MQHPELGKRYLHIITAYPPRWQLWTSINRQMISGDVYNLNLGKQTKLLPQGFEIFVKTIMSLKYSMSNQGHK